MTEQVTARVLYFETSLRCRPFSNTLDELLCDSLDGKYRLWLLADHDLGLDPNFLAQHQSVTLDYYHVKGRWF